MNIDDIVEAAHDTLAMMSEYKGAGQGEFGADRIFYGLLQGRFGHMTRQHRVAAGRIDFRYGTYNPVVIEIVLRKPHDARATLFARTNRSELRKLTKVQPSTARLRALLLLDRALDRIQEADLRGSYANEHAGRGRFGRHVVRVIYVHRNDSDYHFRWTPFA
ncbi:MAG: hypothetical protein ACYDA3_14840 [Gaiellaceae bacterium]